MIEKMFKKSSQKLVRKIMAIIMLPMFVIQMSSLNFLFLNVAYATEGEAPIVVEESESAAEVKESASEESPETLEEEAPEEEAKEAKESSVTEEENTPEEAELDSEADLTEAAVVNEVVEVEEEKTDIVEIVEVVEQEEEKIEEVEEEVVWDVDGKIATIAPVEIGEKYVAPQNEGVTVTFSKLPENSGSLTIEEITLTSEQISALGALSDKAYDITSDMENGTFEYDLTLPKPENENNVQIKFAQDVDGLKEAEIVSNDDIEVKSGKVNAELDHMTVFVVVGAISSENTAVVFDESNADILINEFVYSGDEWVELYNKTNSSVSLSGWKLCELNGGSGSENCHNISANSISAHGFVIHELSNDLNDNPGDAIILRNSSNDLIDEVSFRIKNVTIVNAQDLGGNEPDNAQSIARTEDSGSTWEITNQTKNSSNETSEIIYVDDDNISGTEDGTEAYPFNTIPEGLNAASDGKEIKVKDGNYVLSSTLTINKEVSIIGESEGGVMVNASSLGSSYGIKISASNVIIEKMTILPPIVADKIGTKDGGAFPIHASNTPGLLSNLTLENITIENSNRTAFDIHGVDGGLLKNLTAKNSAYGNGLSLTGSSDIIVEGLTTSGNAWGGIALYNSKYTSPYRATHDITLKGNTFSIGEDNELYEENEFGLIISGIDAQGYDFKVTNNSYRGAGSENFVHYQRVLDDARSFALALQTVGPNTASIIKQISTGDYYVADGMRIQNAVNVASNGNKINVESGTFEEQISVVEKNITIKGDGIDKTIVKSPEILNTSFTTSATNKAVVYIRGGDVNIKGLTVDGFSRGNVNYRMMGIAFYNGEGELDEVRVTRIENLPADGMQSGNAIYAYNDDGIERSITVKNSKVDHFQKNGITMNGAKLTANVTDNDVECYGVIDFIAQNGIQFGWNSTGIIEGNNVNGCSYIKPSDGVYNRASAAILLYDVNSGLNIANNKLTNSDSGINAYNFLSELTINDNEISDNYWGVAVYDSETDNSINFSGNSFENNTVDLDNYTLNDINALNTKSWSVDDQENKDQIENVINHNCANSPYIHGACNEDDYEAGGSVDYWMSDETAPTVPVNGAPHDKIINTNNFDFTWGTSTDESNVVYKFQSSLNPAQSDGILTTGLWKSEVLPSNMIHSSGAPDGKWYWQVMAIDEDGNESAWSEIWNVTLDTNAPAKLIINKPMAEQYFTTAPIRNEWTTGSDAGSGIDKYRVWYSYDDNHGFSDSTCGVLNIDGKEGRCRDVDAPATSRNHIPNSNEQGGVTIRVQAIDNAGNEGIWSDPVHYFYDATAPAVPSGIYFKDTKNNKNVACGEMTSARNFDVYWNANNEADFDHYEYISFNADGSTGPIRTFEAPYFNASWWTVPVEGVYGVQIRAVDNAGNKSAWFGGTQGRDNSCKYTADWTKPTVPIINGFLNPNLSCGAITNIKNITVDWSDSTDNFGVTGYDYHINYPLVNSLNRGDWNTSFTASQYRGSLNEGIHNIEIRAKDAAGNVSEWSNICSITYDSIVPDVPTLNTPANEATVRGIPSLTNSWSAVDSAIKYVYESWYNTDTSNLTNRRWEQVVNAPATSKTATNVPDATFWWRVKAVDAAGNVSAWSELWKVTVDNTAPTATVNYSATSLTSSDVIATLNPSEPVTVTNNSGNTYTFTNNGEFIFEFKDEAGNTGSVLAKVNNIDKIAPVVEITAPEMSALVSGTVAIEGSVTENNPHHYWLAIFKKSNGQPIYSTVVNHSDEFSDKLLYSWNTNNVEDGEYQIKFAERDSADNRSSDFVIDVTVDNTAPILSNKTDFGATWYNSAQTSTFNYTDANMIEEYVAPNCEINTEGASQTCSITPNICDEAGNCNIEEIISNGANIDFTKPSSTIAGGGEDNEKIYSNDWDGNISGTASDDLSGVSGVKLSIEKGNGEYWNGSAWQVGEFLVDAIGTTAWNYTLTSLEEDSYTIKSHAIDNAGNVEDTYTLTIVYDKTIPEINLAINPSDANGKNDWYDSIPEISLSASDSVALDKIEYQIDSQSGNWSTYTAPVKINDGKHVFYYRSLDKAGNYSSVGIKNVKVDTVNPEAVRGVDAYYDKDKNTIKLDWRTQDNDIYKVYVYRGSNKNFNINSGSRIAENDDNDEEITDRDVTRGEKYYYKLITVDEAGNKGDVKNISVKISEDGTEAVIIDEGTESAPQTAEVPSETPENQSNEVGQETQNYDADKRVEGVMASQEDETKNQGRTWPYYVGAFGLGGFLLSWFLRRRSLRMARIIHPID